MVVTAPIYKKQNKTKNKIKNKNKNRTKTKNQPTNKQQQKQKQKNKLISLLNGGLTLTLSERRGRIKGHCHFESRYLGQGYTYLNPIIKFRE